MQVTISFPDGKKKEFESGCSIIDVAKSISSSLARDSVIAVVDNSVVDLSKKLDKSCSLKIITYNTKDKKDKKILLDVIRHSCAHLFAQAIRELYGNNVKFGFGPVIENGFYYDFDLINDVKISTDDFEKIEKKMHELAGKEYEITREEKNNFDVLDLFNGLNEKYKVEHIKDFIFINNSISLLRELISFAKNKKVCSTNYLINKCLPRVIEGGKGDIGKAADIIDKECKKRNVPSICILMSHEDLEETNSPYWKKHPEENKENRSEDINKRFSEESIAIYEEILKDLESKKVDKLSIYSQGNFIDLCKGPHVPNTRFLKYFKLMKVSGAYWRNNSKQKMLQRVYGTCWTSEKELNNYLIMLKEAEKRDHRKLGNQLDLFHLQGEAIGCVFWHPRGYKLYQIIQNYMRNKLSSNGYIEVKTPQIVSKSLWEKSGHWSKYREHMFITRIDEEDMDFAIKPMNCPCHVQIFKNKIRSYKDLPIRMAEFGKCHRYEPSGSLHGLMRVRGFVQDDAHIFCTEDQIASECVAFYKLLCEVYNDFGFKDIKVKFSDRPEVRIGSDEIWEKAEKSLCEPMKKIGVELELNKGEGAFYGPKLEFTLCDAIGREWQCGTFQVDFNLGERLGAEYIAEDGSRKVPIILHRAILGSFERFIAILIENFSGSFPIWLAPVQVVVIGISNDFDDKVISIANDLQNKGIRCEYDITKETISYKVRKHSEEKIPYIVTIGKKEIENGNLSIRKFGSTDNKSVSFDEFVDTILKQNNKK